MGYEPLVGSDDSPEIEDSDLPGISEVLDYLDVAFPKVVTALDDLMCACSRRGLSRARNGAVVIRDSAAVAFDRYRELRDSLVSVL